MQNAIKTAYLGLGSNLGERLDNIKRSINLLLINPNIKLIACSNIYETAPVGGPEQGPFLNACISIYTAFPPVSLLREMQHVENAMKRIRAVKWGPRIIDLDLLIYEKTIVNTPFLQLPHPRITERDFVLVPLANIASDLSISGTGQTVGQVLKKRAGNPDVKLYCSKEWCKST